jgi:hypothetical protein
MDASELRREVEILRAELAGLREAQEQQAELEMKLRRTRDKARKGAQVLSELLAERLAAETAAAAVDRVWWRRGSAVMSADEAASVELLRRSRFFDPAWYLRTYLDVARRGEEPTLHFLRHWQRPLRQPCEAFDIAQYIKDHPETLHERINPVIHFLGSPESDGTDTYPPRRR